MRRSSLSTQALARLALLAAAAAVLGFVEHQLSAVVLLPPGIKLGLANTTLLYAIYLLGPGYAALLMVVKVLLSGLMSGNLAAAALYSLGGGVLSLIAMLVTKGLGRDQVSIIGVSVMGAVFHNVGQLAVAALVVGTPGLLYYFFILLAAAVITGIITGVAGQQIIRVLGKPISKQGGGGS